MSGLQSQTDWRDIAARKQSERESKIPAEWRIPQQVFPSADVNDVSDYPHTSGILTPRELQLTEVTASEVIRNIATGTWTSEEVVLAVCKRAAIAQQLVNCLTEICFDDAVARAKALDAFFKREGRPSGPLHGLPVSLKDQFRLPGLDATIGYASFASKADEEPSLLVKHLEQAGAVLYVKTNVPSTLMMAETANNVFGRTLNPYNRKLTPGGSSGGESALIALRGSYLGVGTDIGGSIRNPCSFTGLFGLRPSYGRISYHHVANTYRGQEAIRSTIGPMCRSVEDIRLFMSTLIDQKPWIQDAQCLPIPWRAEQETLPDRLCFGLATSDGMVAATPPLRRALDLVQKKLVDAGHKIIEYTPHENAEALGITFNMWSADGGQEFQSDAAASGEPLQPILEAWLGRSANPAKPTVSDTWENQSKRTELAQRWLEHWQGTESESGTGRPIDGLIIPNVPFPAFSHERRLPWYYGTFSPLLDLTTGVFPVTKVHPVKDRVPDDWQPISEKDKEVLEFYGQPENHTNAPVGLALVGRRLEEEKVTAMLQVVSDIVGVDY